VTGVSTTGTADEVAAARASRTRPRSEQSRSIVILRELETRAGRQIGAGDQCDRRVALEQVGKGGARLNRISS